MGTKVTTPNEMEAPVFNNINRAVLEFDAALTRQAPGLSVYQIFLPVFYSDEICKEVAKLYSEAGWKKVSCFKTQGKTLLEISR